MSRAGFGEAKPWIIRGRNISATDVASIGELVERNRSLSRSGLALALCELWQWRSASGRWKVNSAFAILAELERRERLQLPALRKRGSSARVRPQGAAGADLPLPPILPEVLEHYRPLHWVRVSTAEQHRQWNELINQYHYLGAPGLVGANLKYLVSGRAGELLGAVGWQSAVKDLGPRDRLVGWTAAQRAQWLGHVVTGVRFLLLPWVGVPNLASVLLSEGLRILQRDWLAYCGTAVWLVESFIDPSRFHGASYRAANWVPIGWTRGFAKRQGRFVKHGQRKEVYIYVLAAQMRRWVHGDAQQPLLTREFLLAQREVERQKTFGRSNRMSEFENNWKAKIPLSWNLAPEDLQNVSQELKEFAAIFGPAYGRVETRELGELYLRGLLSDAERKNMEAMALELRGPEAVRGLQRLLNEYKCDEQFLQQTHWKEVAATIAHPQGVWSVDASEFPKKGTESVGVAHQYCGALGKTANCQSGVFVSYVTPHGHVLVEGRLYMPECWFDEAHKERREECQVPKDLTFKTKPQLATEILSELIGSGLFPGHWITYDCSFGRDSVFLESSPAGYLYLAEVPCSQKVWPKSVPGRTAVETSGCTVEELAEVPGLLAWETVGICEGEKGPIVAGFARLRVYANADRTPASERWLLLRNDPNMKIKYALSNAPESCPLSELVRVSQARWPIERCFQENKGELGMDHYEHRSWTAWHRHMRLSFLAQLFLVRLRLRLKKSPGIDSATSPQAADLEFSAPAQ